MSSASSVTAGGGSGPYPDFCIPYTTGSARLRYIAILSGFSRDPSYAACDPAQLPQQYFDPSMLNGSYSLSPSNISPGAPGCAWDVTFPKVCHQNLGGQFVCNYIDFLYLRIFSDSGNSVIELQLNGGFCTDFVWQLVIPGTINCNTINAALPSLDGPGNGRFPPNGVLFDGSSAQLIAA